MRRPAFAAARVAPRTAALQPALVRCHPRCRLRCPALLPALPRAPAQTALQPALPPTSACHSPSRPTPCRAAPRLPASCRAAPLCRTVPRRSAEPHRAALPSRPAMLPTAAPRHTAALPAAEPPTPCCARRQETLSPQQLRKWVAQRGSTGDGRSASGPCPYVHRTGPRAGNPCGRVGHDVARCFYRLEDAFSSKFDRLKRRCSCSRWTSARLGVSCDCTTVTPLSATVPVTLADPTYGPLVARSSSVLPCPVVPSRSLTSLHLPSFTTNLVSTSYLQDQLVTTTIIGGERMAVCTDTKIRDNIATFTRRPDLGHPSLLRLRSMHSRRLVCGLPQSLPLLSPTLAPPCTPRVEGRQGAAPHSLFPPTTTSLQTLHMDVWGPAPVHGPHRERYILLVVDDFTRYTTVFPLQHKGDVRSVLIPWIRAVRLQQRASPNWSIRGGCSHLHDPCGCSLFPVAVCGPIAMHQLNLWPRVSQPEVSPTLLWIGEVGDALPFWVWGSLALVRDPTTDKLSPRTIAASSLAFPLTPLTSSFTTQPPAASCPPETSPLMSQFSASDVFVSSATCHCGLGGLGAVGGGDPRGTGSGGAYSGGAGSRGSGGVLQPLPQRPLFWEQQPSLLPLPSAATGGCGSAASGGPTAGGIGSTSAGAGGARAGGAGAGGASAGGTRAGGAGAGGADTGVGGTDSEGFGHPGTGASSVRAGGAGSGGESQSQPRRPFF
ncbi:unnamed protein product [Closterium sp. NIES-54]